MNPGPFRYGNSRHGDGRLVHETIGDYQCRITVPRMRAGAVDHAADEPITVARGERAQLILARTGNDVDALLKRAIGLQYCKQRRGLLGNAGTGGVLRIACGAGHEEATLRQRRNVEQHLATVEVDHAITQQSAIRAIDVRGVGMAF